MSVSDGVRRLVDYQEGRVAAGVHFDPDLYRAEESKIFGQSWLVVGEVSMIPNPGDYITNYMGEVPVIVTRTQSEGVVVLVNRCTHRGNQVCLFDRGNTRGFTCSYHGWSYGLDGSMKGAPFEPAVYGETLDKSQLGLQRVRVGEFGGLIFATFSEDLPALEDWLAPDVQWWLETHVLAKPVGGLEALPGWHRYSTSGNWKLTSENFTGDNYHVWASAHVSPLSTAKSFGERGILTPLSSMAQPDPKPGTVFDLSAGGMDSAPLGIGVINTDDSQYEADRMTASRMSKETQDWVEYRYEKYRETTEGLERDAYCFTHGLLYPNLGLMGYMSPFVGRHFLLFHPRGVEDHEVWQWTMVERDAPQEVKDMAAAFVMFTQHMAGVIAPDDVENMERIVDASHSETNWGHRFHYEIQLDNEVHSEGPDLPGTLVPNPSELNQRRFYEYWSKQMAVES